MSVYRPFNTLFVKWFSKLLYSLRSSFNRNGNQVVKKKKLDESHNIRPFELFRTETSN